MHSRGGGLQRVQALQDVGEEGMEEQGGWVRGMPVSWAQVDDRGRHRLSVLLSSSAAPNALCTGMHAHPGVRAHAHACTRALTSGFVPPAQTALARSLQPAPATATAWRIGLPSRAATQQQPVPAQRALVRAGQHGQPLGG